MNRATIYAVYFSSANEYIFDVQIFTCVDDGYPYFGKRFFATKVALTMEQTIEFCKGYGVPENMREWCVDSVDCRGGMWYVWCEEKLVYEIMENTIKTERGINWYNFNDEDFYWAEDDSRYVVTTTNNFVYLTKG